MMGAVPRQIKACEEHGLHPLFAVELYVNQMEKGYQGEERKKHYASLSEAEMEVYKKNNHLLAIAYSEVGYKNLVRLSTWGFCNGFYKRPRVNHEMLLEHKEGIIFTSCCYNGEIGWAFDQGKDEAAMAMVEKYMAMFGSNFYLELMMLDFSKQKPFDKFLVKAYEKYKIPLIISQDVHYCFKEDSKFQRLMLMTQTKRTIQELEQMKQSEETKDLFELQDEQLWMKSEEELNEFWYRKFSDVIDYDLFVQAKQNTVKICNQAKGVEIDRSSKLPQIPNADEILKQKMIEGAQRKKLLTNKVYQARLMEEYELIKRKGFSTYFLIQQMMTDEARRVYQKLTGWRAGAQPIGCGRGSAASSLICYALGITGVDPIKHDLLFSRFLSESRGGKMMKTRFTIPPKS